MNEEEEQQKLFGGLYDSIEDSAIGKFFDLSGEKKAAVDQAIREGKAGGVSKNLQKVVDLLNNSVGAAMTPVTKTVEAVSDVTNIDERAVSDGLKALFYGRGLIKKVPKIQTPERFKPVNKRTVDVKADTVETASIADPVGNIIPSKNFLANLRKRISTDIDRSGITGPLKIMKGDLIMDVTAGGSKPENPLDAARYYEITNPDSYVTDQADPNYGKLKSEVTYIPTGQQQLNIKPLDPLTRRTMIKRGIDNNLLSNGRLDYEKLLTSKTFIPAYRRLIAGDWATVPEKGLPLSRVKRNTTYQNRQTSFINYRSELLKEFKEIYGADISRLGFPEKQLDLDHRLTLVQSLGLLQNTAPGDSMWTQLTEYGLRRGYTAGDAEANLDLIDPETHRVKTNFFNDLHGLSLKGTKRNMKYWGGLHRDTGKTRNQIMKESHLGPEQAELHMEVAKDYFDVVDRGDAILETARSIFKAEHKVDILPEEIVSELMNVIIDPELKYSPTQLRTTIEDIIAVEQDKINKIKELAEIELELERYQTIPQYREDDLGGVEEAELEKRKKALKTVRKSKFFSRYLDKLIEQEMKAESDPQQTIPGVNE